MTPPFLFKLFLVLGKVLGVKEILFLASLFLLGLSGLFGSLFSFLDSLPEIFGRITVAKVVLAKGSVVFDVMGNFTDLNSQKVKQVDHL